MNGLSFSELCCLFCCPPCPSRIAAKLAFLPPEPTYAFIEDEGSKVTISLSERAEWQYTEREKESVEGFYARTSRGNRIACLFVRCSATARFTILYSHGNAVDLGQMSSFYLGLGSRINCNIFSYDYSGYGVSGGKPSEKNLYADIDAAWHALRTRYGISPENIILYGQSIGTVPTVDLAARYEVGAVVLHSPLMSGMRVAFPNTKRTWFFDAFPSIDKVPKVTSPVLVIHGTEDDVINFSHGLAIYERCPRAVEPLWVEGAGHNDVELYDQYLERLKQFIDVNQKIHCKNSLKETCSKDDNSSLDSNSKKAIQQDEKSVKEEELATNVQENKYNKTILEGTSIRHNFRLNHISQVAKKHISLPKNLKNPFGKSQKNIVHRTLKNSFGQGHKKADTQISHTTLVDIQVEDCRQFAIGEKSFPNIPNDNNKSISDCKSIQSIQSQFKAEKKSPINQFKYSSIESVLDSECTKNNKKHCCKILSKDVIIKGKKLEEHEAQAHNEKSVESTKKFLWGTKSASKSFEKTCKDKGKTQDPMEKKLKAKRILSSPLRKFGRSSLTIEPDKIMINLPKCSPCACRLAASSKILSNDSSLLSRFTTNRESPHHAVRLKSPSHVDVQTDITLKTSERTSMQANLLPNVQQKSRYTPRSRSVGELCNIVNK
ncbi:hypothetical protein E2986_00155 [Frieseomelitta varia]|uniref:palmitoyl-protein hydrolase n=1 Tax=Frieseomelitta varia TaxID=561572 RepID=A0A833VXG9_9HYME|nr:hypothetical protein E2986_00155 [Frieseomelitta varia]